MEGPSLTTAEAAERCGTTPEHIRKLARSGSIPHYRIGALIKFDPVELDDWITSRHVAVAEEGAHVA